MERTNRLYVMLIKWSMSDIIRGSIPDKGNVKDYMDVIEEKIIKSDRLRQQTY